MHKKLLSYITIFCFISIQGSLVKPKTPDEKKQAFVRQLQSYTAQKNNMIAFTVKMKQDGSTEEDGRLAVQALDRTEMNLRSIFGELDNPENGRGKTTEEQRDLNVVLYNDYYQKSPLNVDVPKQIQWSIREAWRAHETEVVRFYSYIIKPPKIPQKFSEQDLISQEDERVKKMQSAKKDHSGQKERSLVVPAAEATHRQDLSLSGPFNLAVMRWLGWGVETAERKSET